MIVHGVLHLFFDHQKANKKDGKVEDDIITSCLGETLLNNERRTPA